MNSVEVIRASTRSNLSPTRVNFASPLIAKSLLLAVSALAFAGGMIATDSVATARAIADAGGDWANLLRAMAALKLLFASAATAMVLWRLGAPISATRWGSYAVAAGAAWVGPGLIWGLSHIVPGAFLLHAGLIAMVVMVWRDPATRARLSEVLARRRAPSRMRG